MKKLFITCILVGAFVPLFQNCGQKSFGNGDPYEDPSGINLDNDPGYSYEEPPRDPVGQIDREIERTCQGTGEVKQVQFYAIGGKDMISIQFKDLKERSVSNTAVNSHASLNVTYSNGHTIKSLSIFDSSVTIGIEISGALSYEQLNCVVH